MWEIVATISSAATTVIILATALAAVGQIRQLRLATQLQALLALYQEAQTREYTDARIHARDVLPALLRDPQYRAQLISGDTNVQTHREFILVTRPRRRDRA